MTNTHSKTSVSKQNRRVFLVAVAVFTIPFLAALTLHKTGLYKSVGTTNRGTLVTPPAAIEALQLQQALNQNQITSDQLHKTWWMVYVMPEKCNQACQNSLYQMRQIHSALGAEQHRVSTMLVTTQPLPGDYRSLVTKEFPNLLVATTSAEKLQHWFTKTHNEKLRQEQAGLIYLVDTMGAVFMYYPTYADEQQAILKGRDMLKDLQKVLKLSKIG